MSYKKELKKLCIIPDGFKVHSKIDGAAYGVTGYMHQASFLELENGDILIACGGNKIPGEKGGDYGGVWTYAWRSSDNGKTFSEIVTPFENNAFNTLCTSNPTMLKLDDRILMISRSATKDASESSTYTIFSFDNGYTWGSEESGGKDWNWIEIVRFDKDIDDTVPRTGDSGFNQWGPCCFSCRPKVLKSGRIIFSLCVSWLEEPVSNTKYGNYLYYSDDKGKTWGFLGAMKKPPTGEPIIEPAVLELPDGRLIALVRAYVTVLPQEDGGEVRKASRYYYFIQSDDGGKTWSEPWPAYLGSERWNGAMSDIAMIDDNIYILGTFRQYHAPDRGGLRGEIIPEGMQRTPLLLLEVPLEQVLNLGKGAPILQPTAVRPVGNKLTQDLLLGGCFASVQMSVLKDGTLGILCDTQTRITDETGILFWNVDTGWLRKTDLALFRGPIPLVEEDGSIRVLNSQTTIMPTEFRQGCFPVTIETTVKPHHLQRHEPAIHPLLTVLTNADLNVPKTYHPQPVFTSVDVLTCKTKNGYCLFTLNTSAGRIVTDVPICTGNEYRIRLVLESRFNIALYVDGKKAAEGCPIAPGMPGSFTLGFAEWPPVSVEVSFKDIAVEYGDNHINNPEHPFLLDSFIRCGAMGDSWAGAMNNLVLKRADDNWVMDLPARPWKNWLRYGGLLIETTDDCSPICKVLIDDKLHMELIQDGDLMYLSANGKKVNVKRNGPYCAISSSALHERTFAVTCGNCSGWIEIPLIEEGAVKTIQFLFSGSIASLKVFGWDFPPSAALRMMESGIKQ